MKRVVFFLVALMLIATVASAVIATDTYTAITTVQTVTGTRISKISVLNEGPGSLAIRFYYGTSLDGGTVTIPSGTSWSWEFGQATAGYQATPTGTVTAYVTRENE